MYHSGGDKFAYLVRPTIGELIMAGERLAATANRGSPQEAIAFNEHVLRKCTHVTPRSGVWEMQSGRVSARYITFVRATRLGVAWWTDAKQRRHVTLKADCVRTNNGMWRGGDGTWLFERDKNAMELACPPLADAIWQIANLCYKKYRQLMGRGDFVEEQRLLDCADWLDEKCGKKSPGHTIRELLAPPPASESKNGERKKSRAKALAVPHHLRPVAAWAAR